MDKNIAVAVVALAAVVMAICMTIAVLVRDDDGNGHPNAVTIPDDETPNETTIPSDDPGPGDHQDEYKDDGTFMFNDTTGKAVITGYIGQGEVVTVPRTVIEPNTQIELEVIGIAPWGFANSTTITSVVLHDGIASIGAHAFENCAALKSFSWPEAVASIGDYAFANCTSLESVDIPKRVGSIGVSAFDGCSSLGYLLVESGVASLGDHALRGCVKLQTVSFKGDAPALGDGWDEGSGRFTVLYVEGAEGFTPGTWEGHISQQVPAN